MKKFLKRSWGVVATIIVAALLLVVIADWVIPNYDVDNGSMRPTIPIGAKVFVQHEATYKKGDIITFKATYLQSKPPITVTHRIVAINSNGDIITKGDYNESRDYFLKPVTTQDVVGRVYFTLPVAGTINMWTRANVLWIVLGAVGLLLFVFVSATVSKKPEDEEAETLSDSSDIPNPAESLSVS